MNKVTVNFCVQIVLWIYIFIFLGKMSASRITDCSVDMCFGLLETVRPFFKVAVPLCTFLPSHQQCIHMRVPAALYSCQHLLLSVFLKKNLVSNGFVAVLWF